MTVLLIVTALAAAIIAGIVFGALFLLKRKISKESSEATLGLIKEIDTTTDKAREFARYSQSYAPAHVAESLNAQIERVRTELAGEGARLKEVESKLDSAQKNVEQREAAQQEIKTARENEEALLEELQSKQQSLSSEAMSLEQKLAQSLKNLDKMMSEVELTQEQRTSLTDLSTALETGGGRLRDLLMEHQVVSDRIQMLRQQHHDLENEYTKLVEQQLGE